ncbi:MAG: colicin transporter, partial [Alphaproteobacteria bacterium]|nr:colicin transporter [Alphaproteobacteria bacterium]
AEAKAKEEAKAEAEAEAEAEEKAKREAELNPVDPMVGLKHAVGALPLDKAIEFAEWLNGHIQLAMAAKAADEAKAEGKADFDPAAELAKAKAEGEAKRKAA